MSYADDTEYAVSHLVDLTVGEEALLAEKNHYWKTPSSGSKFTNGTF